MIQYKELTYSIKKTDSNSQNKKSITLKVKHDNKKSMYIVYRALIKQLNEKRQGNANTKTRSEIRGGGRKPWKQKGTGKARAGSIRSPLWRGGGIIFGPQTKKYKTKMNKKEKQLALRTLIYNKFQQTIIVEELAKQLVEPKTKILIKELNNLGIYLDRSDKLLIITEKKQQNLYLSVRNLSNIELIAANQLNILALIKANKILITAKGLSQINNIYNA